MKIRPIHNYVLIQPKKADDITKGGIIIPDNAKEKPQQGEVLAVGPGRVLESGARVEPSVSVGHVVLFNKYGGVTVNTMEAPDGALFIREDDIIAVMES